MRILGKPDKPFEPRNEIEKHICLVIKTICSHDIRYLWTRQEYMEIHTDMDDNPIDPEFDFIIKTGVKHKDWYCSGNEYGVNLDEKDILKIELLGNWIT